MTRQQDYKKAVQRLASQIDCSAVERVQKYASVTKLACVFFKTPKQVAHDINKLYLDSYRPLLSRDLGKLNLVEDWE